MKALFIKDIMNLKKIFKSYIFILLIYFFLFSFLSNYNNILSQILFLAIAFSAMVPMTSIAFDEQCNWEKYALSMPISRKDIVYSKYILGFFLLSLVFLFGLIISLFSNNFLENLTISFIAFFYGLVIVCINFPFIFKFGVEKARFVNIFIMASVGIILLFIYKMPQLYNDRKSWLSLGNFFKYLSEIPLNTIFTILFFIGIFISIILIFISVMISLKIYNNKEF